MWIQVRSMDGRKLVRIDGLSKLTKIEDLRLKLVEPFDATVDSQKLFYRGKLMVDGHSLFDYNVGLNEIVQIMIKPPVATTTTSADNEKTSTESGTADIVTPSCSSNNGGDDIDEKDLVSTYKLGDVVDVRDPTLGAWFEARIVKLNRRAGAKNSHNKPALLEIEVGEKTELKDSSKKDDTLDVNRNVKSVGDETPSTSQDTTLTEDAGIVTSASNETPSTSRDTVSCGDDGIDYHIAWDGDEEESIVLSSSDIRPRARVKLPLSLVKVGDRVMVNHNCDEPLERGYWYDAVVTGKKSTRTVKELTATVYMGKDLFPVDKCSIVFVNEIFAIEKPGTQMNEFTVEDAVPEKRENKPECSHCLDNPKKKCRHCGCAVCSDKKEPSKQIMCDECDSAYHIYCLTPPLLEIPDVDEWYCPECKVDTSEVVLAGQKLKESKKKSKMASSTSTANRDWGKGMACQGRTKICTIVAQNHFGLVPGVEVGSLWKYRVQVSETGIHRPHVAGIHGREDEGSYSIVLAGGYEDDQDDGDEFTYTGSGGRDLSGNKRTAEQSSDQVLTRMNRALAKNCAAPIDAKNGADACDKWKAGKPVRVVRSCKGRYLNKQLHSEYAPEEGNRYDGLYKVVKYWPEKGKSGFIVWRYLLRRDDPSPAPWTKAGKKRIEELGITMQYPDGYEEKKGKGKSNDSDEENDEDGTPTPKGKGKGKGKRSRVIESNDEDEVSEPKAKKLCRTGYKVDPDVQKLIDSDELNQKLWTEALACTAEGSQSFIAKVEELFLCICCQEIVYKPVTAKCLHNLCKSCLERSFKAEVYTCPMCRYDLGKDYKLETNKILRDILVALFPGYENGR